MKGKGKFTKALCQMQENVKEVPQQWQRLVSGSKEVSFCFGFKKHLWIGFTQCNFFIIFLRSHFHKIDFTVINDSNKCHNSRRSYFVHDTARKGTS